MFSDHKERKLKSIFGKFGKFTNTCTLNNTLLCNQQVKEEITKEIRRYSEMNENENITYGNLWDAVRAMFRERFIAINVYIKRE